MELDSLDLKVIKKLVVDGRISWSDLSRSLDLSGPATAERVRRMEEQKIITGFTALVAPESIGCKLTAFVAVTLEHPNSRNLFLTRVAEIQEIQECHHVSGDDDYLLKVRCRGPIDLDQIISIQLKSIPGVTRTRTTIVLYTHKESASPPILLEAAKNELE